ncbi:MAG: hypothetical protein QF733_03925 [Phycisphaerales bacterium]|jgi:hypothetical protein|nr:hypothetical protein [Phycisphaerales bacterium]
MHTPDPSSWNAPDEPLDARCDATDAGLDAMLDQTAPRDVPEGLVQRVLEASRADLDAGRATPPPRLVFPSMARLAAAACVAAAVLAAFWLAGLQPNPPVEDRLAARDLLPVPDPTLEAPAGPMDRFRALQAVNELDWQGAVDDLAQVVWAVQNGAASHMVLAPGRTPMEAVENELDSVRVVAKLEG